ncbi:uncharacterized protein ACN2A1_001654 isoform 4-T8 [Glossina fuscipes fuscipes]
MQMALQPMLVRTLDGMDVTCYHIGTGQYRNAVVTNGLLLTWGNMCQCRMAKQTDGYTVLELA